MFLHLLIKSLKPRRFYWAMTTSRVFSIMIHISFKLRCQTGMVWVSDFNVRYWGVKFRLDVYCDPFRCEIPLVQIGTIQSRLFRYMRSQVSFHLGLVGTFCHCCFGCFGDCCCCSIQKSINLTNTWKLTIQNIPNNCKERRIGKSKN